MCVIIFKPSGVALPDYEVFDSCWHTNPDGFGMCWSDGSTVTLDKGYMDKTSAWLAMSKLDSAHAAVFHFRISTSGLVDSGACHPYPVTSDTKKLRALHMVNLPYAVAHNGIIGDGGKVLNDTQLWVLHELAPMMGASRAEIAKFMDRWADRANSRFVMLYGDGDYHLAGDWIEDNGLHFSNTHWGWGRRRTPKVSGAAMGYNTEWEDYADSYDDAIYDGYLPMCPVCGSDDTVAHYDSQLHLCECYDCKSVFNGLTYDIYTVNKRMGDMYREMNRAMNTSKAAYYAG